VTDCSMISLNDYWTVKHLGHIQYSVEFVNLCVTVSREGSIDRVKRLVFLHPFKVLGSHGKHTTRGLESPGKAPYLRYSV